MIEDINYETEVQDNHSFSELSLIEIISELDKLSNNSNPYTVSKKADEIKVVFYKKLKTQSSQDNLNPSENNKLHPLEIKFKKIFNKFKKKKKEFRIEREKKEQNNLSVKIKIISEISNLTKEDESIKITFEKFRALQKKWNDIGKVPISNQNDLWLNYKHQVELFYDYIKINKDLRDLDFKRNLELKELLCQKTEQLINEKSINTSFKELQKIHEKWKEIGPVVKEQRDNIWQRFQEASRIINRKRNDYFLSLKKENNKNLEKKSSICNEINSLIDNLPDSHHEWKIKTEKLNKLIEQWKKAAPIHKKELKKSWKELRDSTNNFYSKKNTFYKIRKTNISSNVMIKIKICEQAEELKNSTDWESTSKKLIKLQKEWKESPFVPSNQSSPLWKRFKMSCDQFFNSKKEFFKKLDKDKDTNLKIKKKILLTIKKFKVSKDVKSDIEKIHKINDDWNNIGEIPKSSLSINNEYRNSINTIYESLNIKNSEKEKLKLESKISFYKKDLMSLNEEKNKIKSEIEIIKKNINQYENNISFFTNGKESEKFKTDIIEKIEISKSKLLTLKDNLSILNKI